MFQTVKKMTAALLCVILLLGACSPSETVKERVNIVSGGTTDYVIIRGQNADEEEIRTAKLIRSVIALATGVTPDIKDDWLGAGEEASEKEILVGETNRTESTEEYGVLTPYSYSVSEKNGKLVFAAKGEGTLDMAVIRFLNDFFGYDAQSGECNSTSEFSIEKDYKMTGINGTESIEALPENAGIITGVGYTRLYSGEYALDLVESETGSSVRICEIGSAPENEGKVCYTMDEPAQIRIVSGVHTVVELVYSSKYNNVYRTENGFVCHAEVLTESGSVFSVRDCYSALSGGCFSFDRTVYVEKSSPADKGFESAVSLKDINGGADRDGYEYFIPSVIYRDTAYMETWNPFGGSLCSDLGNRQTYVCEICSGLPLVMARSKSLGTGAAVVHIDPQIVLDEVQTGNISVTDKAQYGSVGYRFDADSLSLEFIYPSDERPITYEVTGAERRTRFHPVNEGFSHAYTVGLIFNKAENYNDAMVDVYKTAYNASSVNIADIDIDTVYEQQIDIYDSLYTEYKSTAGYTSAGVYFDASVLTGRPFSPVSYLIGFSGAQTAAAYEMYREGVLSGDPELKKEGQTMLDFWSSEPVNQTALPVTWWTPARDGRYAGSAFGYADYLRVFCDGMEGLVDAYLFASERGVDSEKAVLWLAAALKTADFLVNNQSDEGTWCRAYDRYGHVTKSSEIFGGYAGSSPLASYTAVRFLHKAYMASGDERYKDAAMACAEYTYKTLYCDLGKYVGACPDHINIVDKESSIYAMYCFESAYLMSGDEKYLKALEHAAVCAMSFVCTYDYSLTESANDAYDAVNPFKEGGIIGYSFIATGYGSLDVYASCMYSDLFRIYVRTGDKTFLSFASFIQNNTKLTSDIDGSRGYYYKGFNIEAVNSVGHIFSTAGDGVWLPWVSHVFVKPYIETLETFGCGDVDALSEKYGIDELKKMLEAK